MESYWKMSCNDDESICKDGPGGSKLKKQAVMALRINKGDKELSLYGNGKLVDKVVASPSPDSDRTCLVRSMCPICHHANLLWFVPSHSSFITTPLGLTS